MINQELALYDAHLEQKPQIVVLNKMDLPDAQAWEPIVREQIEASGYQFSAISAASGEGVKTMLFQAAAMLESVPEQDVLDEVPAVIRPLPDEDAFSIRREGDGWRVEGRRIERVAAMTYWEFEATTRRFQQILETMGISNALLDAGINNGDMVFIGDEELEWSE
jgi:GTP-binding protein